VSRELKVCFASDIDGDRYMIADPSEADANDDGLDGSMYTDDYGPRSDGCVGGSTASGVRCFDESQRQ
jgi:hypothetical protein